MQLSEHFSLAEMISSQTASRNHLDNTPNAEQVNNLRHLCATILEPARAALGAIHISSGYRSVTVNKAVGGSATSAHCLGFAADCEPLMVSEIEFARWVAANCEFDQIIMEFGTFPNGDPAWVHVSSDRRNRKQILRTVRGGGYAPVNL